MGFKRRTEKKSFVVEYIYGFVWWGGLYGKSMTSPRQIPGSPSRLRAQHRKLTAMRYYGNVMTTTIWRLRILHLQQYSRKLNLFVCLFICFIIAFLCYTISYTDILVGLQFVLLLLHTGTSHYPSVHICTGIILFPHVLLALLSTLGIRDFFLVVSCSSPTGKKSLGHRPLPRVRPLPLPHMKSIFFLSRYNHLPWHLVVHNWSIFPSSFFYQSIHQPIALYACVSFYPAEMDSPL